MRIHIKTKEKNIRLRVPSCLIMNRFTAYIGISLLRKKHNIPAGITAHKLQQLFREVHRLKKKYPKWSFMDMTDKKGTHIHIKL